jgi:hypothetical protein
MRSASCVVALLAASLGLGCYNPNITDGGLACGPGRVCPDNFHCGSDGLCHRAPDGGQDMGPVCMSASPPALCSRDKGSRACNPTCNAGCTCGWCGAEVDGTIACLTGTPGTKAVGEVCDPSRTSDCAPGLRCRNENCKGAGRCYKFCDSDADCPTAGTTCTINNGTLCSLPDPGCDLVTGAGCPTGFGCYSAGVSSTECGCVGTAAAGASCDYAEDCMPGYGCAGINSPMTDATPNNMCTKLCKTQIDCGLSGLCMLFGTYGYCL